MTQTQTLPTRQAPFPATIRVHARGGRRYHPHLEALRDVEVSGVYAITDATTGQALYVGESHTGRLFDTITRHFRKWSVDPQRDAQGRRFGGTTYHRDSVKVALMLTAP